MLWPRRRQKLEKIPNFTPTPHPISHIPYPHPPRVKTKKQVIFEEAAKLFQEKGYSAASMRDLADRVNLKASSLYSHIKAKEEILQKICFDNASHFTQGMDTVEKSGQSPEEKVRALLRLHLEIALDDPTSITVFNDEWKHLEEPHLTRFLNLRRDYENRFRTIIQEGIASGVFRSVDPTVALFTLLSSLRWIHYWHRPSRKIDREALLRDVTAILLNGLRSGK